MITIYSKDGMTVKATTRNFEYNGVFKGSCSIISTIKSESPIDFEIGDYCIYRGERFELNYVPAKAKFSSTATYGDGYVYDNIKFNSLADELTRCDFLDVVLEDNNISFSSKPDFYFHAASVHDLADRIQANLDRVYTGANKWTVTVSPDAVSSDKNISVSRIKVWDALALADKDFGLNFIIRNRTITIGSAGLDVGKVFGYGLGNGLFDIKQTTNEDALIITRLRAYGSTRNIPYRYYNNLKDSAGNPYILESVNIDNLMLPDFPKTISDPKLVYVDSPNIAKYGVREGSVYFDGSDESGIDIYPSIEGMTAQQLASAGITVSLPSGDNGNIDEVLGADNPTDDGVLPEQGQGELDGEFTIYLKDLGFDLSEKEASGKHKYATSEAMQISMKSGMCVGRTFEVVENGITKDTSLGYTRYKIVCKRFVDDRMNMAFPNKDWTINAGDKFVILGIAMPDIYIQTAAQRLLDAAQQYLDYNDDTKYTYQPSIDDQFMANNPSIAENVKEGDILSFRDTDLNIDASVIIQTLKITHTENSPIPSYDLVLNNDKIMTTVEKMQESINTLVSNSTGVTIEQVKSLVKSIGTSYFLSKIYDDTAHGNMNFLQNVSIVKDLLVKSNIISEGRVTADQFGSHSFTSGQFGSGFRAWVAENGQSYAEFDNILARREFIVNTLTAAEIKSVGGQILLSLADMVASDVKDGGSYWKVSFDNDNGTIPNNFAIDDQVICRKFNSANIKYYWAKVTAIGADYIDISKTDKDGSGVPAIGDEIIQLGNRTNTARQSAIILSAYGSDAPSIKQYAGINSYDLTGKEVTVISPSGNKFKGDFTIQSSGKSVTTAINDAKTEAINTASTDATNKVNNLLSDIANDNLLTPSEKQTTLKEWNIIQGEYNTLVSQADEYGISSANYKTKYNDLNSYVSPLLSNMTTNSAIVGNTFRNNFKSYYDAKTSLLKAITDKAKQLADNAQQSADTANNELANKVAYSEYNSQMQVLDSQISSKVSQVDFNTLGGRVSTAESNITQLSGSITSVVEKVDNIQVGGKNLLNNSSFEDGIGNSSSVNNSSVTRITGGYNGSYCMKNVSSSNVSSGYCWQTLPTIAGKEYTISCYVKADTAIVDCAFTAGTAGWVPVKTKTIDIGTEWSRIELTFTAVAANMKVYILKANATFYIDCLQLEEGNKATAWGVSQNDIQTGIDKAQNTADNAQNTANLKNRSYYQDETPTIPSGGHKVGDLWYMDSLVDINGNINADSSKNIYQLQRRWNGSEWIRINWSVSRAKITQTDSNINLLTEKTGVNNLGEGETLKSLIDLVPDQIKLEVSSIKVGGRNIIPNTNQGQYGWHRTVQNGTHSITEVAALGVRAMKATTSVVSTGYNIITKNLNHSLLKNNTQYVLSFDVYCDVQMSINFLLQAGNGTNALTSWYSKTIVKETWIHVEQVMTTNNTAISNQTLYINGINYLGSIIIANLKLEEGNKPTDWSPSVEDTNALITNAQTTANNAQTQANTAQTNANEAKALYNDISNDDKLTPNEKQSVKKEWDNIVSEYSKNITEANKFSVSTASYTTAYNTLNSYISPLLSNMTVTSNIVGTTFRSRFNAYHSALIDLLNSISSKAKEIADSKTTINEVKAGITINSDSITAFGDTFKVDSTLIANAIETSELSVGDGNFRVGTDGKINAKGANIEGSLKLSWNGSANSSADTMSVVDSSTGVDKTKVLITSQNVRDLSNIAGNTIEALINTTAVFNTVSNSSYTWNSSTFTLAAGKTYDVEIPVIYLTASTTVDDPRLRSAWARYTLYLKNITTGAIYDIDSAAVGVIGMTDYASSDKVYTSTGRQAGVYQIEVVIEAYSGSSGTGKASIGVHANSKVKIKPIVDAIEIGANGLMGSFTSSSYFHLTTGGFYVRMDSSGFKITKDGTYVSDNMYAVTPTWRKL